MRIRTFLEDRRPVGAPMVHWLNPTALVTTGVEVLLSGLFSRYADKRGLVAAVPAEDPPLAFDSSADLWIDYVADAGDGWASTYAVASAACRPHLVDGHKTQPGRVLVFGGDQVYPSADYDRYREKLVEPYAAAARVLPSGGRSVLAIPGNHDWYDGLTAFMRLFSEGTNVSVWESRQARSYFLARLSPPEDERRWWLVGIDIGFGSYLDAAQLRYFRNRVGKPEGIHPHDLVILCTGKPTWASRSLVGDHRIHKHSTAKRSTLLEDFEREIVECWECELPLVLSGDLHHYSRYEMGHGERQRVTAGGGGAYLFPTHGLKGEISWPNPGSTGSDDREETGCLKKVDPDPAVSKSYRKGIVLSPLRNLGFVLVIAGLYAAIATQDIGGIHGRPGPGGQMMDLDLSTIQSVYAASFTKIWSTMFTRPLSGLLLGILFAGLFAFTDASGLRRWIWAIVNWLVQIALMAFTMLAGAWLAEKFFPLIDDDPGFWQLAWPMLVFFATVIVLGAALGGLAFGAYLWVSERLHMHANDAYSAMAIPDHKGFVRMRLAPDGSLDLFAFRIVGIRGGRRRRGNRDDTITDMPAGVRVELIEHVPVWKPAEGEVSDGVS